MADKEFIKGQKYSEEEYIELSIVEMNRSQSEHTDRADPKVGAVLVDRDGAYFDKAHRGELRKGDHGEYTLLERKHHGDDLSGFTLYTTLEPCVKRNMPKKGCYKRCINARLKKVVIGHIDPDPTVARNGVRLLEDAKIAVAYYDRKYEMIIAKANEQFFKEAEQRAKEEKTNEIYNAADPIENELLNFQLTDLSEEAQNKMIDGLGLTFKFGSDAYLSFLNKMKLIKVDAETKAARPTGLGLLLLGKEPQVHFPQARIKFTIRRPNTDPIIKDFDGPLILIPDKIEEYLEFIFPKGFSRTNFHRDETTESSHSAVLEVIMNAIVHRDYTIEGARIMVDIDDEKIAVSSPGIPLSPVEKLNDFTAPSNSRNPKIAYLFFELGFVEERGFGMEELSKLEADYGLPRPHFELDGKILKATIYRNQEKAVEKKVSDLPGLTVLKEHKVLGSSRYMELTGVSERTARRHLSDLVTAGKARKVGDGPGTEYIFIE